MTDVRKVYCDCCGRAIQSAEPLFSMEISRGQDKEIILEDMCIDCYERIKYIVDNARSWRMSN